METSSGRQVSRKRWMWALVDVLCWVLSVYLAAWLRLAFDLDRAFNRWTFSLALSITTLYVVIGAIIGPYAVGHLRWSFDEVVDTLDVTSHRAAMTWLLSACGVSQAGTVAVRAGT